MRKTCKHQDCTDEVWRTGNFTYSNYCWKHDPEVIAAKEESKALSVKKRTSR